METVQEVAATVQVEAVVIVPVEAVALEVVVTAREEAVVPEVLEVTVARAAAQEALEAIEVQVHREAQDLVAEGHLVVEVAEDDSN
jgi:citrate lyase gamma subunit